MEQWVAPQRPALYAEQALVKAILQNEFPPGSYLPGERDLAVHLGVTRPTLREVLQRLERDGWVTIQHGKPTRVNDYWREGGLNVLGALARFGESMPAHFVTDLLEVRVILAPAYTRLAVLREPEEVAAIPEEGSALPEDAQAFAVFDWRLHHFLTVASGNPIYTLILNGFGDFYWRLSRLTGGISGEELGHPIGQRYHRRSGWSATGAAAFHGCGS